MLPTKLGCRKMDFLIQDELGFLIMRSRNIKTFFHVILIATLTALVFIFATPKAYAYRPITGTLPTLTPRALALGQTLRASPSGTAGVYQNPAVLAMSPVYHMEGMYQYTGEEDMHMFGTVLADSVTTVVAAGASFNYASINDKHTKMKSYDGRLAIAGGIGNFLYLGGTVRYLYVDYKWNSDRWGPGGMPALPASGSKNVNSLTFDAGGAIRLGNIITLGVVGYNLIPTESAFAPLQLGTGASVYVMNMLLIEVNTLIDFSSHDNVGNDIEVGGELFVGGAVALRGGYIYDFHYRMSTISAGLAYVHAKFSIDAAYMHELIDDGRWALAFSIKYFIN
jgi:hypothetical protein